MFPLGERIRARRKELGLTQSQLGGTDLTKGFISLVEKGRAKPSIDTLILIAQRLQKPVAFFLDEGTALSQKTQRVVMQSAWAFLKRGEFTRAAEAFTEALEVARNLHDKNAEAECSIGLGSAQAGLRQFDAAIQNVQKGKELAEASHQRELLARVHHVLGLIEYYRRDLPAAREHFLAAHRLLEDIGDPDVSLAGSVFFNLGSTYQELGDSEEAARWYQHALTVLEPSQDLARIGLVHVQMGAVHRDKGNHDAALAHLSRAEHIFEVVENIRVLAQTRNNMGIMLLEQGQVDDALAHLQSSLRIKERLSDDPGRARTLTELARALIAKGTFSEAEKVIAEAERLARKLEDTTETARIQVVRARLQRGLGHLPDAVKHYKQAIASFEALAMRADLAHACNELGEVLIESERPSEAAPYLARALHELKTERVPGRTAGQA